MFQSVKPKTELCEKCLEKPKQCAVWERKLCYPCVGEWYRQVAEKNIATDVDALQAFTREFVSAKGRAA